MVSQLLILLASARKTFIYLLVLPLSTCVLLHMQISQANTEAALGELRLRLEAHQRMLARWEAKVARQLEKIVGLQKNVSRKISTESAPATPFPGLGMALHMAQKAADCCKHL